jgi:hypothetical protein
VQLTIRFLGAELLHLDLSDSPPQEPDEDTTRDLSGGYLASTPVEAGKTEMYMGFTNGRQDDE